MNDKNQALLMISEITAIGAEQARAVIADFVRDP
jgi:hypothetical protein